MSAPPLPTGGDSRQAGIVRFRTRAEAGRLLGERLLERWGARAARLIVLALPRGGLPVGCEIAHTLGAPLDVLAARRIWAPGQPDLAIGAVAPGGVCILHDALIAKLGVSPLYIQIAMAEQVLEADQMMRRYRRGRKAPEIAGRAVIVVDDGIASGTTAAAALEAARRAGAAQLILAAPVAAGRALESIRLRANEVVSLLEVAEPDFGMVSQYYEDFSPPGEAAMLTLLERAAS